jgi:hypothetical protein
MEQDDLCNCPPEAGHAVCDLPAQGFQRPARLAGVCPECARTGKPVQGQTVKALLSVSLRAVRDIEYLSVVYFSSDGRQSFTLGEIRERVYQKELEAVDVPICYCFRHTAGDLRMGSAETRAAILEDINSGIGAGQCACDLRNPQGSCCLGNVRSLLRKLDRLVTAEP